MFPLELPTETYFERTGINPVGQRLRIGQRLTAMKINTVRLACSALFLFAFMSVASSDEFFPLEGIPISDSCEEWIEEAGIYGFEYYGSAILPELIIREPASEVTFTAIWFQPFSSGILIENRGMEIIHCNEPMTFPYFALAEAAERFRITDTIKTVEVHFHSIVNCGSPCIYAQIDTIVFSEEQRPWGYTSMKTIMNDYPSRWFRGYLTEGERAVFDKIIEEG